MNDLQVRSSVDHSKGTLASRDFPWQSWLWKGTANSEMVSELDALAHITGQLPSDHLAFRNRSRRCRRTSITYRLCMSESTTCPRSCQSNVSDSWRWHSARRACHCIRAKKHSGICLLAVSIVIRGSQKSTLRCLFGALPAIRNYSELWFVIS